MASFGTTKGYGKKDINFFAAFTESARKQARMLLYVILLGLLIFGVFFVWLIIDFIKNGVVKAEINKLNEELASPEYANLEIEYKNLQKTVTERNQYYYALTEMRRTVDETDVASADLALLLGESIPNSAYVKEYDITGSSMVISGYTFNYYSYLELVNIMQNSDAFVSTNCSLSIETSPVSGAYDAQEQEVNVIDVYYEYTITANLTTDSYISVSRFVSDDLGNNIPLGGVESIKYTTGDPYDVSGINTYEYNGITYYLSYIMIDGMRVEEEQYSAINANNAISGVAMQDTNIQLYYTAAAPEVAEGGEQE